MSESQKGSTLAGVGGIAFGVLTVIAVQVGATPGGNYVEADVANYVGSGHFPTVIATGYLAVIGVLGLICLLAYLRAAIAAQPDRGLAADIFWGAGLASAASFAVGWGLVTGIAVAAAEGGSGASVPPPVTYVLSDTFINVLFGSGAILLGFALIALMLSSRASLPNWLRWVSLVAGVLALTAPFYFASPAVPLWGIVAGVYLLVAPRLRLRGRPPSGARETDVRDRG
jgi:hypothetical protein